MTDQWRYSPNLLWGNPEDSSVFLLDPIKAEEDAFSEETSEESDALEQLLEELKSLPKDRLDRIRRIKDAIENGSYYSDDKFRIAVERLRKDIGE